MKGWRFSLYALCSLWLICSFFKPENISSLEEGVKNKNMAQQENTNPQKWHDEGYADGRRFALNEADYDELAAIYRAGGIPKNWDIFRAEILNEHLGDKGFDFQTYEAGFAKACIEVFERI